MFFRQCYDERLAQASYIIGSTDTQEALVVDPQRDADIYMETARAHALRIVATAETHIHADFLSGARELAHATGARLYLSGEGGSDQSYLTDDRCIHLLKNGEQIQLGEVRLHALHTPGHTPEHLCFEVFDGVAQSEPMLLLSGDFMFVGDLGRPDLLEQALGETGAARTGAQQMFRSLQHVLAVLPDFVQIWPGHGAGSACGRALGNVPSSTLGYERRFAWWSGLLARAEESAFVEELLHNQPDAPTYFAIMKRLNRGSMRLLGQLPQPPHLQASAAQSYQERGAILVDTRPREAFIQSHARGAIHIPDGPSFSNWSGWFIPTDARVVLIANSDRVEALVRGMLHVGIDDIIGFISQGEAHELPQTSLSLVGPQEARQRLSQRAALLDVRSDLEFREKHIPDALHISAGRLLHDAERLPKDRPIIVLCAQGERSVAAASVLQARGYPNILSLAGGFDSWRSADFPVAS